MTKIERYEKLRDKLLVELEELRNLGAKNETPEVFDKKLQEISDCNRLIYHERSCVHA